MYINKYSKEENSKVLEDFIIQNSFATLISISNNIPTITHLPLDLQVGGNKKLLVGHFAKANKHWKTISTHDKVFIIFQGPHGYITPTWYDHVNVPTWNYSVVHIEGKATTLHDETEIYNILKFQVDKYESNTANKFTVESLSKPYLTSEIKGIVGLRIDIEKMEENLKLSQNRDKKNFNNIIEQLEKRDGLKCPLSEEMKKQMDKVK